MSNIVRFTSAIASLCLAALPVVALATSVHAAPAAVTVKIGDLNLTRPDQAAELQVRIKKVTKAFCDRGSPAADIGARLACERAVKEEVMAKLSDNQRQDLRIAAAAMLASAN
jgi:UrcA family protein